MKSNNLKIHRTEMLHHRITEQRITKKYCITENLNFVHKVHTDIFFENI